MINPIITNQALNLLKTNCAHGQCNTIRVCTLPSNSHASQSLNTLPLNLHKQQRLICSGPLICNVKVRLTKQSTGGIRTQTSGNLLHGHSDERRDKGLSDWGLSGGVESVGLPVGFANRGEENESWLAVGVVVVGVGQDCGKNLFLSACAISMRCITCESYSRRNIRRANDADKWFTHFAVFFSRVVQRVFLTVR